MSIKQAIEALEGLDEAYCRAGAPLTRDERIEDRQRLIKARAALAALRSMPAEPVAWQWRKKDQPWSLERTFNSQVFSTTDDSEVRPLFATPHTEAVQDDCETVDRLLKGLGLDPARCRTEGGALNVGRTLSLLQDGCTSRCPTGDLESAAMEMYERSGGKDWMREPETEKWRAIANIGFKWAKRTEAVQPDRSEKIPLLIPSNPGELTEAVRMSEAERYKLVLQARSSADPMFELADLVEQATAARLGVKMGDATQPGQQPDTSGTDPRPPRA